MKIAEKEIIFNENKLILTNQRVAFWERESALILSDFHIGKTAHFRKNGIAIPADIFENDLKRLSKLIKHFQANKIIVVGDLLHAGDNADVDMFCEWRRKFGGVEFHLIEGNHDRLSKKLEEKLCLTYREQFLEINGLFFTHDVIKDENKFQITGHIHPGIVLNTAVSKFRLPCFVLTERQLLLPAFSEFTGLDTKNTPKKGAFFVFTKDEIFEIEK